MICLYCKKEFTPKFNYNTKKNTEYCSRSCIAKMNRDRLTRLLQLRNPDWLFEQYWIKKRSMRDISIELGCAESRVYVFMDKMGISRRKIGESLIGKKKSMEHRINLSEARNGRWRGENNPNWQGGFGRRTIFPFYP